MHNLAQLKKNILKNNPTVDIQLIEKAFYFAKEKHSGQKRKSGEEYYTHPVEVSYILSDFGMDTATLVAALLHDVIEDTDVDKGDVEALFGKEVAELVDGVTHLTKFDFSHLPSEDIQDAKYQAMIESLRKFFLAMAQDMRVVIIKLADRLHNMRTLDSMSEADQKRKSRETIEVFAPLADRMGMGKIKAELEDLSFMYINPAEYKRIQKIVSSGQKERQHYLAKINKVISAELKSAGIVAELDGRVKHLYSIYRKLQKVDGDLSKIYDILAVRVIVENIEECYSVLGIVHKHFKPLIYRIKDYISIPKPNGYQSLHTTVFGIGGVVTEFQIRTRAMHDEAELGVAAHWHYEQTKSSHAYNRKASFASNDKLEWVSQLMDWENTLIDGSEIAETLNIDFFNDRIFTLSPSGDVYNLPKGSTPVDFAYEIHSQIGDRCRGAKVNGKIVTLDHILSNRDVVEIITGPKNDKSGPSRDWLGFVVTAKARQHIRSWYRKIGRSDNILAGREYLQKELALFGVSEADVVERKAKEVVGHSGWKEWDDVLAAIGDGTVTARFVAKKLVGERLYKAMDEQRAAVKVSSTVSVTDKPLNLNGVLIRYAECCKPRKGDKVLGFITQGHGITIHKADCRSLLTSAKEKIIEVELEVDNILLVRVEIIAENRIGLLRDITQVLAANEINIDQHGQKKNENGESVITMTLAVENPERLTEALPKLAKLSGVTAVSQK
jgi:GTP diphosphokinase / guanosine-3',5'-bis(diphosphate) 3'-diphosphatase